MNQQCCVLIHLQARQSPCFLFESLVRCCPILLTLKLFNETGITDYKTYFLFQYYYQVLSKAHNYFTYHFTILFLKALFLRTAWWVCVVLLCECLHLSVLVGIERRALSTFSIKKREITCKNFTIIIYHYYEWKGSLDWPTLLAIRPLGSQVLFCLYSQ